MDVRALVPGQTVSAAATELAEVLLNELRTKQILNNELAKSLRSRLFKICSGVTGTVNVPGSTSYNGLDRDHMDGTLGEILVLQRVAHDVLADIYHATEQMEEALDRVFIR